MKKCRQYNQKIMFANILANTTVDNKFLQNNKILKFKSKKKRKKRRGIADYLQSSCTSYFFTVTTDSSQAGRGLFNMGLFCFLLIKEWTFVASRIKNQFSLFIWPLLSGVLVYIQHWGHRKESETDMHFQIKYENEALHYISNWSMERGSFSWRDYKHRGQ